MLSIPKHIITYRGYHCSRESRLKAIKYGFRLSSTRYENHSHKETRLSKKIIASQGIKKATEIDLSYHFERHQNRLLQDIGRVSGMRNLKLNFCVDFDFDFYKSESSLDSQYAVYSNDEEDWRDSENEFDEAIQSSTAKKSLIVRKNMVKKLFKQAKRVTHCSLTFGAMNQNHEQALQRLPLMSLLEHCHIQIKIRAPSDIIALRDLLNQAKKRNCWPNIKSMVLNLRHSYNKESCTSKFISFCKVLQEIAEIAKGLFWIKIQLKVKYMWRLDESAIMALHETLEKAQNQLIKLSFVTRQSKDLEPLFKKIEEMKNLHRFSVRLNESSDVENINSLEKLTESLKKIQSLRRLKIQGKNILGKEQNKELSNNRFIKGLSDFPQITSFDFQETNQFIDETLWSYFSNSIFQLPQLQILVLKITTRHSTSPIMSPDINGFLGFFAGLSNLKNLRTFTFKMTHPCSQRPRKDGRQIFQAVCEALKNQKELTKLSFSYPWIPHMKSDLQGLTEVLMSLQKLEYFSFSFAKLLFIEPAENEVLKKFAKAISSLQLIRFFSINLEMTEVNNMTCEALLSLKNHVQTRNVYLSMHITAMQLYVQAARKISELKGVYVEKTKPFL